MAGGWVLLVAFADVVHFVRGPERTDAVDRVLHHALGTAPLAYGIALLVFLWSASNHSVHLDQGRLKVLSVALIAYLAVEVVYLQVFSHQQTGSAVYTAMWPPFASGILPALLTTVVSHATVSRPRDRFFFDFMSVLWILGSVTNDALFFCEGGARGTGNCWNWPVVGDWLRLGTAVIAMGVFGWLLLLVVSVGALLYGLAAAKDAETRLTRSALGMSSAAFALSAVHWAGYIWD